MSLFNVFYVLPTSFSVPKFFDSQIKKSSKYYRSAVGANNFVWCHTKSTFCPNLVIRKLEQVKTFERSILETEKKNSNNRFSN